MDFQLKLFTWPDPGPHLIALTKGTIDTGAFRQIFRAVARTTCPLRQEKILIDLVEATYAPEFTDVDDLIKEAGWDRRAANFRIAIVSACDIEQYNGLLKFSALLSSRGVNVSAFCSLRVAVDWLIGE
jgi:hypothetical protein